MSIDMTPQAVQLAEARAIAAQLAYENTAAIVTLDRICQEVGIEWVLERMPPAWRQLMAERMSGMKVEEESTPDDGSSEGDDGKVLSSGSGEGEGAPDSQAA